MKYVTIASLFLLLIAGNLPGQKAEQRTRKADPKEIFLEAESYFLFEEYQEALPLYMRVLKLYPANDNLKYRIGICLLNDMYRKEESIEYLEQAAKNTARDYKENNFKETRAPQDAWFYLGKAYLVNNRIDDAIEAYSQFKKILDPKIYDITIVDEQIEACRNAKKLIKKPLDLDFVNVGEPINSRFAETNPVVTHDETTMLFIRKLQFYDAVFYSKKVNGQWTEPENIMFDLGVDGDMYPCSISADGTEAFFYSNDNYLGTIFTSRLVNGKWTKVRALNSNINTKYWESHACISSDGTTLYFTSNRKGGFGGLDIYKSVRSPNGDWGPAENLGPVLNTKYNEDTPFITEDGKTLYFSSYGHLNMGGLDVNYTTLLDNGSWSQPVNLGYPVNTTNNDLFFVPVKNGVAAYIARFPENNNTFGRTDIFRIEIYSESHPRKFTIKGIVSLPGNFELRDKPASIYVVKSSTRDTIFKTTANQAGEYSITVPAGEYDLLVKIPGYIPHLQHILVPRDYKEGELVITSKPKLMPEEKESTPEIKTVPPPPSISIRQHTFVLKQPSLVRINISTENATSLNVNVFIDDRLVRTDLVPIEKKRFTFLYNPEPGINIIVLTVRGQNMQTASDTVIVNMQVPEEQGKITHKKSQLAGEGKNLLDLLLKEGTPEVKKSLQIVQPERLGNPSAKELAGYLYTHADSLGFSREDFLISLAYLSAHISPEELVNRMIQYSSGSLNQELRQINPVQLGITSSARLINYLIEHASEKNYTKEQVYHSLASVAASDVQPEQQFIEKLSAFASGKSYHFLKNFQLPSALNSVPAITDHLFEQAKINNIPETEIQDILLRAASTYPLDEWLQILIPYAGGNLRRFLATIPSLENRIYSPEQLVRYLLEHTDEGKYNENDLLEMFSGAALREQNNVVAFRKILLHFSDGNLHKTIENLDPIKSKIQTNKEYTDTLLRLAPSHSYSESEFLRMLIAAAYEGDAEDHLYRIAMMFSADTARKLLSLNLSRYPLTSLDELMQFISSKKSPVKWDTAQFNQIAATYLATRQVERYLKKMIPLSSGNLRYTLENIDPYKLGLPSIPALINLLFEQATTAGYDEQELLLTLRKTDDRLMLERAWKIMDAISNDTIAGYIRENYFELTKKFSRNDYFNDLIQNIQPEKIDNLRKAIAGSVLDKIPPSQVYDEMIAISSGTIRKVLKSQHFRQRSLSSFPESLLDPKLPENITPEEMLGLFLKAIYSIEARMLFNAMMEMGEQPVKDYLAVHKGSDLSFASRTSLLESLMKVSTGPELEEKKIGVLLGRIHEKMLAEEFAENVRQFVRKSHELPDISTSEFKTLILTILTNKIQGLLAFEINHLLFSFQDETELSWFKEKLSVYAEGSLKKTIDGLIRSGQPFRNAYDFVEWLYTNAPANGYMKEDVVHILVRIINDKLNNLLARISETEKIPHNAFPIGLIALFSLLITIGFILLIIRKKRRKNNPETSGSIG